MALTVEQELHEALLDIAPHAFTNNDQAIIIAEASDIFRKANLKSSIRKANKSHKEALIISSILEAMKNLASDWNTASSDDEDDAIYIDSANLGSSQIMSSINKSANRKYCSLYGDSMSIINDDEINSILNPDPDDRDNSYYNLGDDFPEVHPESLFRTPNRGKSRSDSQAR